jgi:hypothetical protein
MKYLLRAAISSFIRGEEQSKDEESIELELELELEEFPIRSSPTFGAMNLHMLPYGE